MKREELINAFVFQWGQDGMYDKTLKADVNKLINLIIATQPQKPDKELFEKVYIRSEKDLPEEGIKYQVMYKRPSNKFRFEYYNKQNKFLWLEDIDWYLRPLE